MPASRQLRAAVALGSFAAAAVAGWFMVPEPPESPRPRTTVLANVSHKPNAPALQTMPQHASGLSAEALEIRLLAALDPGPERCTGERLAELCQGENGANSAFPYGSRWAEQ